MEQYQNTNSDQSQTFCGRCMQLFSGGPGNPFCDSCKEQMKAENAFPKQEPGIGRDQDDYNNFGTM